MFKIFLLVLVGTGLGWFGVYTFINNTDHMPAHFSVDAPGYLENLRAQKAKKRAKAEADQKHREFLKTTASAKAEAANAKEIRRPASVQAEEQRRAAAPQQPTEEEREAQQEGFRINSAQLQGDLADEDVLEPLDDIGPMASNNQENVELTNEEIAASVVDGEDGVEVSQSVAASERAERSDSDADMQERGPGEDDNEREIEIPTANVVTSVRKQEAEQTKPETVNALNVAYALPASTDCAMPDNSYPQVGVQYRPSSFAIKGQSLTNIDQLIRLHRKCSGGKFIVMKNATEEVDADQRLTQLRQDEVKYYLLQRRIPKGDILFSETTQ